MFNLLKCKFKKKHNISCANTQSQFLAEFRTRKYNQPNFICSLKILGLFSMYVISYCKTQRFE